MVERYAFRYVFVLILALMGRGPHPPWPPQCTLEPGAALASLNLFTVGGFLLLFCYVLFFAEEENLRIKKKKKGQ